MEVKWPHVKSLALLQREKLYREKINLLSTDDFSQKTDHIKVSYGFVGEENKTAEIMNKRNVLYVAKVAQNVTILTYFRLYFFYVQNADCYFVLCLEPAI